MDVGGEPEPGRWYVRLVGPDDEVERLVDAVPENDHEFRRARGNVLYFHPSFEEGKSLEDKLNHAQRLVDQLRGAYFIETGADADVQADAAYKFREDGSAEITTIVTATVKLSDSWEATIERNDGTTETYRPEDRVGDWITSLEEDDEFAEAVRMFKEGRDDWVELYKIDELLRKNLSQQQLKQVASGNEWDRFRHTANSMEAIGDDARHAKEIPAPSNPMSLGRARNLIASGLRAWLNDLSK